MAEKLALHGGTPVRSDPMPRRALFGEEERSAAISLFDQAIAEGEAFGYNGPREAEYERRFVELMGSGYADGVNSGTNALFVALGALSLDAMSEVIVPPISDPGGVMPVVFCGCVPIPADADPGTYNIGADAIEARISERTRAIVVAHIAGEPADMDRIVAIAEKHSLYVVEDCAQAHGATYKGRMVGTIGHTAAFSTMFGKHHSTGGQGGVFFTTNEDLHWKGKRFADRGKPFNIDDPDGNVTAGLNCNSNELAAAIGIVQLDKLPSILERRRSFVGELDSKLTKRSRAVRIGRRLEQTNGVYWFVRLHLDSAGIAMSKRDFCEALVAEGIPVNPSYRHIPAEMTWFRNQSVFGTGGFPWQSSDYKGDSNPIYEFPEAVRATDEHFNLQVHENFGSREVDDIVSAIAKIESLGQS